MTTKKFRGFQRTQELHFWKWHWSSSISHILSISQCRPTKILPELNLWIWIWIASAYLVFFVVKRNKNDEDSALERLTNRLLHLLNSFTENSTPIGQYQQQLWRSFSLIHCVVQSLREISGGRLNQLQSIQIYLFFILRNPSMGIIYPFGTKWTQSGYSMPCLFSIITNLCNSEKN